MSDRGPILADLPPPPPGRTGWPWTESNALAQNQDNPSVGLAPSTGSGPELPINRLQNEQAEEWPRVSVITPSFNQAQFIEETIRSVLLQDYPWLEYIVVDGGSTDGTVEILQRYAPWVRWISEPDRGQTDAINKGLRMATGDVLAYLNSDDIYLPRGVPLIAALMRQQPEAGLAYGDCKVINEESSEIGCLPRHPFSLRRTIERAEFLPQQAVFWRRVAMMGVGLLDETLHYAMDYDYFIRIARGFPVAYLPAPVAAFRMQRASKTVSQSEQHWREALGVSTRHGLTPWNPWYWIRRVRHWGLRVLPASLQLSMRRKMGRAQDPHLYMRRN